MNELAFIMKIVSWNVNGINACAKKGLVKFMLSEDADIYCFQELKSSEKTINKELLNINDYQAYFNYASKNGYSGVGVYTKVKPLSIKYGIGIEKFDKEGRFIILEFKDFIIINVYFPHSSRDLSRLGYKLEFNKAFEDYAIKLKKDILEMRIN